MMIVASHLHAGVVYIFTSSGDVWRVQIDAEGYLAVDDPEDQVPQEVLDAVNNNWGAAH
jgi:hypothetical protein